MRIPADTRRLNSSLSGLHEWVALTEVNDDHRRGAFTVSRSNALVPESGIRRHEGERMSTPTHVFRNSRAHASLVQIGGVSGTMRLVPSRFNAHRVSDDGTLILYNSYTDSISAFPSTLRSKVEALLARGGVSIRAESGLPRYLIERGFSPAKANRRAFVSRWSLGVATLGLAACYAS